MIVPETDYFCHERGSMTRLNFAYLPNLTIQSHDLNGEANDLHNPSRDGKRIESRNRAAVRCQISQVCVHRLFFHASRLFDRIDHRGELRLHTSIDHTHATLDDAAAGRDFLGRDDLHPVPCDQ